MPIATVFTFVARFEAFTWAGLLVGMFLEHVLVVTDLGVWLFGRLHGGAFIAYFVIDIVAGIRLRWPWWATVLAVLAAIPPLVTWPLEVWYRKRGLVQELALQANCADQVRLQGKLLHRASSYSRACSSLRTYAFARFAFAKSQFNRLSTKQARKSGRRFWKSR